MLNGFRLSGQLAAAAFVAFRINSSFPSAHFGDGSPSQIHSVSLVAWGALVPWLGWGNWNSNRGRAECELLGSIITSFSVGFSGRFVTVTHMQPTDKFIRECVCVCQQAAQLGQTKVNAT